MCNPPLIRISICKSIHPDIPADEFTNSGPRFSFINSHLRIPQDVLQNFNCSGYYDPMTIFDIKNKPLSDL